MGKDLTYLLCLDIKLKTRSLEHLTRKVLAVIFLVLVPSRSKSLAVFSSVYYVGHSIFIWEYLGYNSSSTRYLLAESNCQSHRAIPLTLRYTGGISTMAECKEVMPPRDQ